jgi:arabinose-5-phosphate isomerase
MLGENTLVSDSGTLVSANAAIDITADGVVALRAALNETDLGGQFVEAIRLLKSLSGRLIVTGVGKSGHIGRKLAATFASTGTSAYFVHPTEASHGDLGMIGAQDAILALSWSGETTELASIITYAHRFSVPLIAVTAGANSTLAKAARVALVLPRIREACPHNLAPTTSTVLQLVIGDVLAVTLLAEKGFKPSDFHILHPGGKLGAQLTYVRDLMHTDDRLPLARLGTLMSEGIIRMTAVGFGVLGVTDGAQELVGVITDGDLRRHMSENLMSLTVERVMTKDPVTIGPDEIGARALEVLRAHKVGALFVVDGRTPVGLLRFHDLLRIGLV